MVGVLFLRVCVWVKSVCSSIIFWRASPTTKWLYRDYNSLLVGVKKEKKKPNFNLWHVQIIQECGRMSTREVLHARIPPPAFHDFQISFLFSVKILILYFPSRLSRYNFAKRWRFLEAKVVMCRGVVVSVGIETKENHSFFGCPNQQVVELLSSFFLLLLADCCVWESSSSNYRRAWNRKMSQGRCVWRF